MIAGDKVKYADPKAYGGLWTGVVRRTEDTGRVLVKWDPSYDLSEGTVHHASELRVVDVDTPIGKAA